MLGHATLVGIKVKALQGVDQGRRVVVCLEQAAWSGGVERHGVVDCCSKGKRIAECEMFECFQYCGNPKATAKGRYASMAALLVTVAVCGRSGVSRS